MDQLLRLYHHLPAPLRSSAASVRGLYLRSWRYGPETERLVEEAIEREQWSQKQWKTWKEERLVFLLHRAATLVPYYRRQWAQRRRQGDRSSVECLENWPILDKQRVREEPASFIADDCDTRRMFHEHTSGTTGKPLDLWWSTDTVRAWFALCEARVRRWNGVSRGERWAMMGGQLVVPFHKTKPPFWVWNLGLRQLYMSSYHLAPQNIRPYFEALRRYRPTHIVGYGSSLFALAQFALEEGLQAPPLKVVICNAEPLYEHQRERISQAFQCAVRDTYGMAEIVAAASECQTGALHIWPEVGLTEVLRDESDDRVPDQESGRFISTGLLNADMPLVRYETGDRGAFAIPGSCPCKRELPVIQGVEGRSDDVVVTPDGRRVGRLDTVFKADLRIHEAQIIQESVDSIRVSVVPAKGFGSADIAAISHRMSGRLGQHVKVRVEAVDKIPRTSAGKFRAVVSLLDRKDSVRGESAASRGDS